MNPTGLNNFAYISRPDQNSSNLIENKTQTSFHLIKEAVYVFLVSWGIFFF